MEYEQTKVINRKNDIFLAEAPSFSGLAAIILKMLLIFKNQTIKSLKKVITFLLG